MSYALAGFGTVLAIFAVGGVAYWICACFYGRGVQSMDSMVWKIRSERDELKADTTMLECRQATDANRIEELESKIDELLNEQAAWRRWMAEMPDERTKYTIKPMPGQPASTTRDASEIIQNAAMRRFPNGR